jgi:hypothetical protein
VDANLDSIAATLTAGLLAGGNNKPQYPEHSAKHVAILFAQVRNAVRDVLGKEA